MGLVVVFIAVAIILGVAVAILGEVSGAGVDCEQLTGANSLISDLTTAGEQAAKGHQTTKTAAASSDWDKYRTGGTNNATGDIPPDAHWAQTCYDVGSTSQDSFGLLVVLLVVISAVAILTVVRLLY